MKTRFSQSAKPYVKFFIFYGLLNMAISIMWGAYNNYFPIILQSGNPAFADGASTIAGFGLSAFATSLIMSIDNFFGTFFLPVFGAWGDRSTKRREMGVITGFVCVATFISLPLVISLISPANSGDTSALTPLLILTVALVFVCMLTDAIGGTFRSSYQYSMVPKEHQNKMSSFSVLFGGIGFLAITFLGSAMYNVNEGFPFYIGGAVMLLVLIGFALTLPPETKKNLLIEERRASGELGKFNPFKMIAETYKLLPKSARFSILMVFLIKILSNFGVYGMQTFGSSYMYSVLNLEPNIAMLATAVYFGGYLLMAIPIGAIADKANKKVLFGISLMGMLIAAAIILLFVKDFIGLSICCFFIGAFASVMDVMIIPYVMSFAPSSGTNTGTLYSTTLMIIVCTSLFVVPLLGWIIDITGNYSSLFYTMIITCAIAFLPLLGLAKYGKEPNQEEDTLRP